MESKKTIISIDGGMSTGVICGTYSDDTPFELTHAFQVEGGVEGFIKQVTTSYTWLGEDTNLFVYLPGVEEPIQVAEGVTVLVEKFNARGSANAGFSYRTDALEPLRVEGAIIAMGIPHTYVSPAQQYLVGGKDKADKKKRLHAFLKENGYYISPKSLGSKDADDARSALGHALAWLKRQKHKPTLELLLKGTK